MLGEMYLIGQYFWLVHPVVVKPVSYRPIFIMSQNGRHSNFTWGTHKENMGTHKENTVKFYGQSYHITKWGKMADIQTLHGGLIRRTWETHKENTVTCYRPYLSYHKVG